MNSHPEIRLLLSPHWKDYELVDSGDGLKLERFGPYLLVRPEPQAFWNPALSEERWHAAHAVFITSGGESGGYWEFKQQLPRQWVLSYQEYRFIVQAGGSRHMGFFPEQASHWDWIEAVVRSAGRPIKVLNLFGYTGLASLAAARAGANVTHVDASKKSVSQARQNQDLSGLVEKPIRWLVDDVFKFIRREIRRGSEYDGLILDPPKFGRGPQGQIWELFSSLPGLLEDCRKLLSPRPIFLLLTAYAIRASALSIHFAVREILSGYGGWQETGELVLVERSAGRLLSSAIFTRWINDNEPRLDLQKPK